MIRPIPLFMLGVIAIAHYAEPSGEFGNRTGLFILLLMIPAISIIAAAVVSAKTLDNHWSRSVAIVPKISSFIILISWSVAILFMSWMQVVREQFGNLVTLDELVIVLPVVIALATLWFVTGKPGTRISLMSHRIRMDILLLFIPMMILWTMRETAVHLGYIEHLTMIDVVGILLILVFSPFLVAMILPASTLHNRELRQSVLDVGSRAGVRLCNVLVWNTHQRLINAMAIGFVPWWRSVILTDKLISHLTPRELLSVMGHEVGHHRYRHALFLGLTVFGVMLWSDRIIQQIVPPNFEAISILVELVIVVMALMYVSRQFERQADTYAAVDYSRTQGSTTITENAALGMSNALSAIAWSHNISVDRYEPMHGSIKSRQQHLTQVIGSSIADLPIDRDVRLIKLGIAVLFLSGILI